jgi:hypothetical protein
MAIRKTLSAADPCVVVAGQLCMNMQAAPLCRGYTPRQQDAADTLVSNRPPTRRYVRLPTR